MKKTLNPIFQTFAIVWMLFVTYKYFNPHHPEYFGREGLTSAFSQTKFVFQFLAIIGVIYVGWVLYQATFKDKEKIELKRLTPFKVLMAFSFFLLLFADFWFLRSSAFKDASFATANVSIFSKLGTTYAMLFVFTLYSFAFGKKILNVFKFKLEEKNKLGDTMLSIGTGLGVIMLLIFVLGIFKQITAISILIVLAVSSLLLYKELVVFLKRFFLETFTFEARFFSFEIFFLITLSFVLIMNAIDLIRPMPIGWDDMGVYLNYPKQVAGTQGLLPGLMNNYFLIASVPFTFFKNEYLASMNGMFISFWGGVLMLFAFIAFVRKFFDKKYGLMVASLIYIIPMTMHQSYADMKTDMTLFFFMIMSVYSFFIWFTAQDLKNKKWLILSGIFAGIAFGIKPTAVLLIFGILIGIFYCLWGWKGALGIFLLEWIPLNLSGSLRVAQQFSDSTMLISLIVICFSAIVLFFFANKQHKKLRTTFLSLFIFISFTGIAFAPWMAKNLHESNYTPSVSSILNGYDANKPQMDLKALGVDTKQCKGTAFLEELDRYLGYDEGIMRYVSLPWKVTMNTTVHGFYLDLSFLFLSFVPFGVLLFFLRKKDYQPEKQKIWQALMLIGGAAWLMWLFVGNGVIWYGIFGFILIIPLTAYFFYENQTLSLKIVTGMLVLLSVISVIALRGSKFGNGATISYTYGIQTGLQTVDTIVPNYRQIACIVGGGTWTQDAMTCTESEKIETSPIYRIGTFIAYFIPDNNHRLFSDPQLDTFKCIDDSFGNNDVVTLRKLKEAGYKYIILDLNTATIEKDPKGSLHQKANRFVEWVNTLNGDLKMYVHVYNQKRGIAFMEITDEKEAAEDIADDEIIENRTQL